MSRRRRIGVLGGTFDPVHLGHLVVASEVHDALGLDEVVLVPTGQPWQKSHRTVTDGATRLHMTRLAVESDERFSVSTVDLERPGPTYSIDTVRDLRSVHGPQAELHFLVGADALSGLAGWHAVTELLRSVHVVGFTRPGHDLAVPADLPADADPTRIQLVPTTPIGISSTEVRERVRTGRSVRYLVPERVEQHVLDIGLYREAA